MKGKAVVHASASDEWATPQWLYDTLDRRFHFTLDPCATRKNHKAAKYFTKEDDGLAQSWAGETVFMNPPYTARQGGRWVAKAWRESLDGATVVCLLPARTDVAWFQNYVIPRASEMWFLAGRLKFNDSDNGAPFPSCVFVFSRDQELERRPFYKLGELPGLLE